MLDAAFASRQHWVDAGGTAENLAVADWQVAHAASQVGLADVALVFARAAVERAESNDVPTWLKASAHEGLARAHAAAGDAASYDLRSRSGAGAAREGRRPRGPALVESQLASIPDRDEWTVTTANAALYRDDPRPWSRPACIPTASCRSGVRPERRRTRRFRAAISTRCTRTTSWWPGASRTS